MITFFTTAKKFEGKINDVQLNAIRSWLYLHDKVEVLVFDQPIGINLNEIDNRIIIIDDVDKDFGIPRVDSMFIKASAIAKNDLVCFVNCDIVITHEFLVMCSNYLNNLKENFLVVGQRWDFDNNNGNWDFGLNWESKYLGGIEKKLHGATGSDFFLFPKEQYKNGDIPNLIVGRPGWDLWMIYNARKRGFKTIDCSMFYKVFHQNHDYSHKKNIYKSNLEEPESIKNLSFLPEKAKFDFTLLACNYQILATGKIQKNCSRGDLKAYKRIEEALGKNSFFSKIKFKLFWNKLIYQKEILLKTQKDQKAFHKYILDFHEQDKLFLNIGSSDYEIDARWIKTDIDVLDITNIDNWKALFQDLKIKNVFAEHVWEHLTPEQAELGNKNIFNYLQHGGRFRVAVPDGFMPDPAYIDHVKVGGIGPGAFDHKILYNYKTLKHSLEKVGFNVELQEYWDEAGKFHFNEWDLTDGKVLRSRRFDKRNENGELKYTSLIIDAIKP